MQTSLTLNDICKKCGGYKFAPYNFNTSATVRLCHCTKEPDHEFTKVQKIILDEMQKMRKKL
jgi:phospholipase C